MEWVLDHEPDPGWVGSFVACPVPKQGPLAYADIHPTVVGGSIRLSVHDDDVEAARAWVDAAIRAANERLAAAGWDSAHDQRSPFPDW